MSAIYAGTVTEPQGDNNRVSRDGYDIPFRQVDDRHGVVIAPRLLALA